MVSPRAIWGSSKQLSSHRRLPLAHAFREELQAPLAALHRPAMTFCSCWDRCEELACQDKQTNSRWVLQPWCLSLRSLQPLAAYDVCVGTDEASVALCRNLIGLLQPCGGPWGRAALHKSLLCWQRSHRPRSAASG